MTGSCAGNSVCYHILPLFSIRTTVSSLYPSTTYTISICALSPGDTSSSRCSVIIHTADGQAHAPSGLAVAVLGCHKLQIIWAAPAVPLGQLFSYELRLNGCMVYFGRDCVHTARHLTANTPYTCTVTAITSRGRYQSQAVTKRTAKDEYMNNNRQVKRSCYELQGHLKNSFFGFLKCTILWLIRKHTSVILKCFSFFCRSILSYSMVLIKQEGGS